MCTQLPDAREAIVICTRNRARELDRTLESVAAQSDSTARLVLVVDGSDSQEADRTAGVVTTRKGDLPIRYVRYPYSPAGTRQRNAGVDHLPSSVQIVHFIDDDVTLKEGYFTTLTNALSHHSSLLGVGGIIIQPEAPLSNPEQIFLRQLFLLGSNVPNRVLPSGQTTPAWPTGAETLQPAEWLSTCASSYRRSVFRTHRFDPEVEGRSPRLEDLDFSYRVAQDGPLAVATEARCVHHVSVSNRRSAGNACRERVARRYWFVRKNMDHPLHRLAFWWSIIGKVLAHLFSTHPNSTPALQGLFRGIQTVWTRTHPLLRPDD